MGQNAKSHSSSVVWLAAATFGLLGLLCAIAVGPHLATFFTFWCPALQALLCISTALAHFKRSTPSRPPNVT
jgi:hypothetical protein